MTAAAYLISVLSVIHGVNRDFAFCVVAVLERKRRTGLCGNERRDVLGILVAQAAGVEIGHRVADDARQRVDTRRARAVVPRLRTPERSRPLRGIGRWAADRLALAVFAVAVR